MAQRRGRFIVVVMAIIAIAGLWRAASVEREKRGLTTGYEQAQRIVDRLSAEHARLDSELAESRQTVDGQAGEITGLQDALKLVREQLTLASAELVSLQQAREQLRQKNTDLAMELSAVRTEKRQLAQQLSSLKGLKLAIRNVKRKLRAQRLATLFAGWRERAQAVKDADREQFATGNRGYVVREGKSTLSSQPRLHVHVLEPQPQ